MFDYSLLFVVALWDYYRQTKDKEALEDLWETARTQIALALKQVGDDGIVRDSDKMGWCFLDWSLELNKQAGAQGVLLYALKNAIAIAEELKQDKDADCLKETYALYQKAAKNYFYDEEKQLFISGECRQISYASQVWLILAGAVSIEEGRAMLDKLDELKPEKGMVSPYMNHHYVEALLMCGKKDQAMDYMKYYWGGMINHGADTFWELYNPENPAESPYGSSIVNSYCHAWSCTPTYLLRKYFN